MLAGSVAVSIRRFSYGLGAVARGKHLLRAWVRVRVQAAPCCSADRGRAHFMDAIAASIAVAV